MVKDIVDKFLKDLDQECFIDRQDENGVTEHVPHIIIDDVYVTLNIEIDRNDLEKILTNL